MQSIPFWIASSGRRRSPGQVDDSTFVITVPGVLCGNRQAGSDSIAFDVPQLRLTASVIQMLKYPFMEPG